MSWIRDIFIVFLLTYGAFVIPKIAGDNIFFAFWGAVVMLGSIGSFGFEFWLHYVFSKRMTKQYPRFDLFIAAMVPNNVSKMNIDPKDVLILKDDLVLFRRSCFVFHTIAILLIVLSTILLFQYS